MPYDNSNSGMLTRNDRKQQDTHPDFKGQCEIGGVHYWISAWTKVGKAGGKMEGRKFFSLKFKPKDAAHTPLGGYVGPKEGEEAKPAQAAPGAERRAEVAAKIDQEDVPF